MTTERMEPVSRFTLRASRLSLCAAAAAAAWCLLMVWADPTGPLRPELSILARNVAAGLFLAAGLVRFAIWRLDGNRDAVESAAVLGVFAIALVAAAVFDRTDRSSLIGYTEAPLARLIFVLPVLALVVLRARHSHRLMRRTALAFGAGAIVCWAIGAVARSGSVPAITHPDFWLGVEAVIVGAWCALAVQSLRRVRFLGRKTDQWLIVALVNLAIADVMKSWAVMGAQRVAGLSAGVQLAAAVVILGAATVDAWTRIREHAPSLDVSRALVDTERRLTEIEQLQRERLHDARSAVLGVVGASELLTRPQRRIAVDPRRLSELVAEELHRLETLLDMHDDEPIIQFDLSSAIAAVVLAHRLGGMTIETAWHGTMVAGRPRATATAIDNLLRNAHRHAPGASVLISSHARGASIEVEISDDGPGIPKVERDRVLRPGVRGSQARGDGSGLGLYSAAKTMAAQGGALMVCENACGGAKVVLRLPAVVPMHAVAS